MDTKICNDCKEDKKLDEFYHLKKKGTDKKYPSGYCKVCDRARAKILKDKNASKYQENRKNRRSTDVEFAEDLRKKKRENSRKNIQSTMLSQARNRANRKGIEFNLDISDIVIPELCPILKIPFIIGTKDNYLYTPSLDRLDSTKGYIKGNVKVITMLANSMKNAATEEQLLTFANNIKEYLNN